MLEGIKVLSENYIEAFSLPGIIVCSIILLLGITLFIINIMDRDTGGISFSIIIFLVPLLLLLYMLFGKPYTQYKVTIDDTVNFKEFNDRYEIKDQDGEIYTIVERHKE